MRRPDGFGAFEFAILAGLRANQLRRGCAPRVDGDHTLVAMAQMEVAARKVEAVAIAPLAFPHRHA